MDKEFESIGDLVKQIIPLQKLAIELTLSEMIPRIDSIIDRKLIDNSLIENTLDALLEHAYDSKILEQFKRLLRYNLKIDPEGTKFYVDTYLEMWEE